MKYILIVSEHRKGFLISKMVFGPFDSTEQIKEWITDRYHGERFTLDIFPMLNPQSRF